MANEGIIKFNFLKFLCNKKRVIVYYIKTPGGIFHQVFLRDMMINVYSIYLSKIQKELWTLMNL